MRNLLAAALLPLLCACATDTPPVQAASPLAWRASVWFERDCSLQPFGDLTKINWFKWPGKKDGNGCYALVNSKDFESRFTFCAISTSMLESVAGVPDSEVMKLPIGCALRKVGEEYEFRRRGWTSCTFTCYHQPASPGK